MPDDLNKRVQARLAQLQDLITNGYNDKQAELDPFTSMFWDYQTAVQPLVDSWGERWDRHRPVWDQTFWICRQCRDPESALCADGRAVLREIGIEP